MKTDHLGAALCCPGRHRWRADATPVGLWKTIDDETKTEKSLVRIVDNGGVLSGKIEKLLDPEAKPTPCATSAPTTARTSRCWA
jgi:hypothetical protein